MGNDNAGVGLFVFVFFMLSFLKFGALLGCCGFIQISGTCLERLSRLNICTDYTGNKVSFRR